MEGNTGANTREKSCEKPPAGDRHGGGLDEETTITRDGRWQHLQLRQGGKVFSRKNEVEQIQHIKDKRWRTDPYIALYHTRT